MRYLIILAAYVFIYIAVDYKRPKENQPDFWSLDWWIIVLLVTVGGTMLLNAPD